MATTSGDFKGGAGRGQTSTFTGQVSTVLGVDINDTTTKVRIDVVDSARLSIQAVLATGVWGSAVVTLKRTLDGKTLLGLGTPITITADGITDGFDVSDLKEIVLEVTTASLGPATVDITAIRSDIPL